MLRPARLSLLLAGGVLAALFLISRPEVSVSPIVAPAPDSLVVGDLSDPTYVQQRDHYQSILEHASAGSPAALHATRKLAKLERLAAGIAEPDAPELFEQILYDMRVPADRERSEYVPGYRMRALELANLAPRSKAPLPWISRGPFNVAGRVRALIVDPVDASGNTWWIGSVGGGIWTTSDAGSTWQDAAPDLANLPIGSMAPSESNPDVMYAGTGESFFNIDTINGNGVLKTVDHGVTWTPLASTLGNAKFNNVSRIIVDPTDPDIVLVSANTGRYKFNLNLDSNIFRSVDGGATWTTVYTETELSSNGRPKKILQLVATPGNFDVQFAGVDEKGILRSSDAGVTWAYSNSGITGLGGRFEIAVSPANTNRVVASAEGSSHSELWVSDDAGLSWTESIEVGTEPNWLGAQGWYDNTVVCHPTDQDIVYVGGIRLWRINLTGASSRTTTLLSTGPVHVDHHNLVIIDDPGPGFRILNANDGGVGVSTVDDTGWLKPTDGLITSQFYGVDRRPGGSAYFGGMQDNGTWQSPVGATASTPWEFRIGGDGYETSWHFDDPMKMIGGYQFNGLARSLDGGATFTSATSGLADTGSGDAPFLTKIAKSQSAPDFLCAVGRQGVWRSNDFGGSWTLSALSAPAWPTPFSSFTDVRISRADADVVWAGSAMDGSAMIHVSTDGAVNFSPTATYGLATLGGISGISTHPSDAATAFVCFSFSGRPKILRTQDTGASWVDISGFGAGSSSTNGFPDVAVYDVMVLPHDTDTIWAATEIGLYESIDAGANWAPANNGLPNIPIWYMTHVEDEVVLATHGRGIWSAEIPAMVAGITYKPIMDSIVAGPNGDLTIAANLRSTYDYTEVWLNGVLYTTIPDNPAPTIVTISKPVTVAETVQVQLRSMVGATPYNSVIKSIETVPLLAPTFTYAMDFSPAQAALDFDLNTFSVSLEAGFSDEALHTSHPYSSGSSPTALLRRPIIVAAANSLLEFDEVVLVEPGTGGSVFGDSSFWDFVIVEGTTDGLNWIPLADGYDSRYDPTWESEYGNGSSGDQSMYRHHVFNLQDSFNTGDHILIRFRLYADSSVVGWGWAIDNLEIQTGITAVGNVPQRYALSQNFPNPFNPATEIRFALPQRGPVSLKVYDVRGREVRTLIDSMQPAGAQIVKWDGRDGAGAQVSSGVYLYRLVSGKFTQQRKMTLLK